MFGIWAIKHHRIYWDYYEGTVQELAPPWKLVFYLLHCFIFIHQINDSIITVKSSTWNESHCVLPYQFVQPPPAVSIHHISKFEEWIVIN